MKSRGIVTLALWAVVLLFVSASAVRNVVAQQPAVPSIRQEVINVQKRFLDAKERGDSEYVKKSMADDFMSIETNGGSSGLREFVEDIHPSKQPEPAPILYNFEVVQLDERSAIVTYDAVFPGNQLEKYQHLSDTWVKLDGQWKLKFQQSTLNLWSAHDLD
jgi:hypothetical protein